MKKPKKVTARAAMWLMQENGEIVETLAPTERRRASGRIRPGVGGRVRRVLGCRQVVR